MLMLIFIYIVEFETMYCGGMTENMSKMSILSTTRKQTRFARPAGGNVRKRIATKSWLNISN